MTNNKLWNKNFIILILANLLFAFSFNMVSTILSKYLVNLGVPLAVAGIVVGMFSITALFLRPASGVIADRFNKKKVLIISNIIIGISVLGYTVSNVVWVIAVFRILHGIGFGMSGTTSIAMASDTLPKERTGEGLGYVALGQIVSMAVAPGLGIMISESLGYVPTFIFSFAFAMLAAVILSFLKVEKSKEEKVHPPIRELKLKNLIAKEAVMFSIISGAMSLNNGIVSSYILLYSEELGIADISLYFLVTAAAMFVSRPLAGRLLDKKGAAYVVFPALAIGFAAMVLHGLSATLWMLVIAAALRAVASSSVQTSLLAESVKSVRRERKGTATSTFYIGADIAQGAGPMIGGVIAASLGYSMMFFFCAAITVLAAALFFIVRSKAKSGALVNEAAAVSEM